MNEYQGSWARRGLIHIPVEAPKNRGGRPARPTLFVWDETTRHQAHAQFFRGDRDLWSLEGERAYQANRKRIVRGRMSDVDRRWAEKNAVEWSWVLDTRTNRDASMANTT